MIRPVVRLLACAVVGAVAWLDMVALSTQILAAEPFDLIIRGGTIYDGRGGTPGVGDVAIRGDKSPPSAISAHAKAQTRDRRPRPGRGAGLHQHAFVGRPRRLLADGRSQGDIRQGVTLEVFGEGWSMGPLNPLMKKDTASKARVTSSTKSPGPRWANICRTWNSGASRATWPRLSAPRPCASTCWATTTAPRPPVIGRDATTGARRRWKRARWASAPR